MPIATTIQIGLNLTLQSFCPILTKHQVPYEAHNSQHISFAAADAEGVQR